MYVYNKLKRVIWWLFMLAVMFMVPVGAAQAQAQAAAKIDLSIDGMIVPTERAEFNITPFYLEARPQMRSNTVFVPVRFVSEILGADVSWANPNISIKYGETAIELTLGSRTAYKNGQKMALPAAPYESGGYTYVPIRFVAEAFACDVEWLAEENRVNIQTNPWELNGEKVQGIFTEVKMIVERFYYRLNSPFFSQKIYSALWDKRGDEVAAPEHFGHLDNMDVPNFYVTNLDYQFMTPEDKEIARLQVYQVMGNGFGQPLPEGYTEYLLYADDKWYALPDSAHALVNAWDTLSTWEQIEE